MTSLPEFPPTHTTAHLSSDDALEFNLPLFRGPEDLKLSPRSLKTALCHRSWLNEQTEPSQFESYERFEYLGDAVLQLIVAEDLFTFFPAISEGELSRMRAQCVNTQTLAELAQHLGVGSKIALSKGEQKNAQRSESVLADVIEALLGATYFEHGLARTRELWHTWLTHFQGDPLSFYQHSQVWQKDKKSLLQEWTLKEFQTLPLYVAHEYPGKVDVFSVSLVIQGRPLLSTWAHSKKRAEFFLAEWFFSTSLKEHKYIFKTSSKDATYAI
jgi:ribonuclease-3